MQPEFDFWVAYIWCAKAILLALALFLTVAIPSCIIAWIATAVRDKRERTKKWRYDCFEGVKHDRD
jgi:hypothetical protein